jgi:hypothetical protein
LVRLREELDAARVAVLVRDNLLRTLEEPTAGAAREDDLTVLVLKMP